MWARERMFNVLASLARSTTLATGILLERNNSNNVRSKKRNEGLGVA